MQGPKAMIPRMWWKLISSKEAQDFARELAGSILDELGAAIQEPEKKFSAKAERALKKAERRITDYKAGHRVNWFQRSRAANVFLWTLKERQCPEPYARTLTEWFVLHV